MDTTDGIEGMRKTSKPGFLQTAEDKILPIKENVNDEEITSADTKVEAVESYGRANKINQLKGREEIVMPDTTQEKEATVNVEEEQKAVYSIEPLEGPVGVDIGTSRIVAYHKEGLKYIKQTDLNAFFKIPFKNLTKGVLEQNELLCSQQEEDLIVMGDGAARFANTNNSELGRPMASGRLNPNEDNGPLVVEKIAKSMVKKPADLGETLCFSLPGPERGRYVNPLFHEEVIKSFFIAMGYMAKGVNEGFLVALSELKKDSYTGIAISCGAGLCNVCLSYLSVPIFTFSIATAGDYIDSSAAHAVAEQINRVRVIKEESLSLIEQPKNRVERALHIYYQEVITSLIRNLKEALEESEHMPKIDKAIPIVLSGGTAMPDGFRDKFDNVLRDSHFPISISEVRMAEEPLYATARGAYLVACQMKEEEE